ncbi:type II toxin-antitoxin system RelE/ParE family toxin [Quisquiliibacterium transsilvanicum]|uniref:Addiction module RelE/StbE family toxin n=1 Tax=Quisquiliibacterium transsilvanicum TaxID=1549638 RepID=A0A7W8HHM8_9BURK|nr:type II toxin-antitoxin system RelE/ParE family toxin [Quisquiliibacterium transsilvanicum]MBB5272244.1 addiction module RelE/StbE family toxin [Quisquiliibacterium transsilvanicum]
MRVLWTLAAEQDRADIVDFIALDNPRAAIRMDEVFEAAVGRLAEHPLMGRTGEIAGTRELIPHESYRLVYEVQADTVWILALVHAARLWPPARS